jgi:hypothetical protein
MVSLLPKSRRWRRLIVVALAVVIVFLAATARLFVWPPTDAPQHVAAVVALDGYPNRTGKAIALAREGYASTVLLSVLAKSVPVCRTHVPGVHIVCFVPDPVTTRGEAEFATRMAARRHWDRLMVVASTTQTTRARIDFKRCYSGTLLMDPVKMPTGHLLQQVVYEWGALGKALFVLRSC